MYGRPLTYTTVNKSQVWISLQENFQGSCSTGTDGIEVDVVEGFFIRVPDMSGYCFSESLGCVDSIPGRNDGEYVVRLRDQVLISVYQLNGGGLGSLSG